MSELQPLHDAQSLLLKVFLPLCRPSGLLQLQCSKQRLAELQMEQIRNQRREKLLFKDLLIQLGSLQKIKCWLFFLCDSLYSRVWGVGFLPFKKALFQLPKKKRFISLVGGEMCRLVWCDVIVLVAVRILSAMCNQNTGLLEQLFLLWCFL